MLLEYKLSGSVTLYHRSYKRFEVGDELTPQTEASTGKHWLASKESERELESYRSKNHPNLPSRLSCVYASFVPRSRFVSKGYLYEIKPVGATHVADSTIIDRLSESSSVDHNLVAEYWEEADPYRSNVGSLEALMEKAVVTKVVDEGTLRLFRDDVIKLGQDAPSIEVDLRLSAKDYRADKARTLNDYRADSADGRSEIPFADAVEHLRATEGLSLVDDVNQKPTQFEYSKNFRAKIGPGFVCRIVTLLTGRPGENQTAYLSATLSTSVDESGILLNVNGEELGKLIRAFRQGKVYKL